jgi:sugar (pentulose or hexulose) kinase
MYTLGIDLGSSYIKAAVFHLESRKIVFAKTLAAFPRQDNKNPVVFEIDAAAIFRTIKELIDFSAEAYNLSRIILSTQMHGFVYRTANRPDIYVSWQDARSILPLFSGGRSAIEVLGEQLPDEDMAHTGLQLKPSLGLCNLYAMLYGEKSVPEGGELFTLGSYLIWRLTGNNICHLTNAAPLGITDVPNRCFHSTILEKSGLAHLQLPQITPSDFTICGYYEHQGKAIAVLPDYGDQQVSILGSMAGSDDVVLNLATAGQLCHLTSGFRAGPYEVRPYFENAFLYTISNMPGGRNLDVLIDFFRDSMAVIGEREMTAGEIWKRINEAFHEVATDLQVNALFYPTQLHFDGGGISGIKPLNLTLFGLLSATYENMAAIYADHIPVLMGDTRPRGLMFSGGVSWKNDALVQIVARKIGLPFRKSAVANEVFNGLYRLSLVSCGILENLSQDRDAVIELN